MKHFWAKLLAFLLPGTAAAIFLVWWFHPTQSMLRRVDALFKTVELKGIGLGGGPRENADRLKTFLAPEFELTGPSPLPSGPIPPETAATLLQELQYSVSSCRITRESATVAFPAADDAIVQTVIEVDVSAGRNARRILRYRCRLEYRKDGEDWLLKAMVLTAI